MPSSSRRTTGIRRPRVAGRAAPGTEVLDPPARLQSRARTYTVEPQQAADEQAADEQAAAEQVANVQTIAVAEPVTAPDDLDAPVEKATVSLDKPVKKAKRARSKEERGPRRSLLAPPTSTRAISIWGAVALVLIALAAFFGMSWYNATYTGPVANKALIDVGGTAQVAQQVGDDLRTIYSFDFTRLDQNEQAARAVITPEFGAQFDKIFADVRARAPQQQAVVTATIANSAVRELGGDHAVVIVFMDQIATRAAADNSKQQIASSGRLTVDAQLIDGRWKVANVKAV